MMENSDGMTIEMSEFLERVLQTPIPEFFQSALIDQLAAANTAATKRLTQLEHELRFPHPEARPVTRAQIGHGQLERPCRDCPFRVEVQDQVDGTQAAHKLEASINGVSHCHMSHTHDCKGAELFNEGGHEGIIQSRQEFVERRVRVYDRDLVLLRVEARLAQVSLLSKASLLFLDERPVAMFVGGMIDNTRLPDPKSARPHVAEPKVQLPLFVVAASYDQFLYFAREVDIPLRFLRYASDVDSARGYSEGHLFVTLSNRANRRDYDSIVETFLTCGLRMATLEQIDAVRLQTAGPSAPSLRSSRLPAQRRRPCPFPDGQTQRLSRQRQLRR